MQCGSSRQFPHSVARVHREFKARLGYSTDVVSGRGMKAPEAEMRPLGRQAVRMEAKQELPDVNLIPLSSGVTLLSEFIVFFLL